MFIRDEIEKVILSVVSSIYGSDDSIVKEIYWFGSSVKPISNPNDVDLLFVYDVHTNSLLDTVEEICRQLERRLYLPIDATLLSKQELIETKFMEKIGSNKIKVF